MQSNLKRRRSDKGPCKVTLDHWLYGSKSKRGKTTFNPRRAVVCSRLSDDGEDSKVTGTRKVGGREKGLGPNFLQFYFRVSRFLNPLDSRTRTTTSTRCDLKFFRVLSKNRHPGILHCTFFTRKVSTVIVIEGG